MWSSFSTTPSHINPNFENLIVNTDSSAVSAQVSLIAKTAPDVLLANKISIVPDSDAKWKNQKVKRFFFGPLSKLQP